MRDERDRRTGTRRSSSPGSTTARSCPNPSPAHVAPMTSRPTYRKLTLLHPKRPPRAIVAGLGKREEMEPERARVVAALAATRGRRARGAQSVAWELPATGDPPATAAAIVTGTILAGYRFDRYPAIPRRRREAGEDRAAGRARPRRALGRGRDRPRLRRGPEPGPRAPGSPLQRRHAHPTSPGAPSRSTPSTNRSRPRCSAPKRDLRARNGRARGGQRRLGRGPGADRAPLLRRRRWPTLGLVGKGVTFDTGRNLAEARAPRCTR